MDRDLLRRFEAFGHNVINPNDPGLINSLNELHQIWALILKDQSGVIRKLLHCNTYNKVIIVDVLNIIGNKKLDEIKKFGLEATPPPELLEQYNSYFQLPTSISTQRIKAPCAQQLEFLTVVSHLMNKFGKINNLYIFVYRQDIEPIPVDNRNCNEPIGFHKLQLFGSNNYWTLIIPGHPGGEFDDIMVLFLAYLFTYYGQDVGILSADTYRWSQSAAPELQNLLKRRAKWDLIYVPSTDAIIDVETNIRPQIYKPIAFIMD